jgi:thiamine-phosphate diphosphorylase
LTRAARATRLHGIYLIVNDGPAALFLARAALEAGIRIVQCRAKRKLHVDRLHELRELTHAYEALLVMNDDVDAAVTFDCDGIHLGPDDAGFKDLARVRASIGDRLIGLSCGTVAEARAADAGDADYLGVGAVFATSSKDDAGAPIGIDGLAQIASATTLPIAAIGGIRAENIRAVRETRVAMAAVISAIADAGDPASAARALVTAWR